MKSKTSFFNKTLFLKNIKRFWPLWGLETFFACIIPAFMWVNVMQSPKEERFVNAIEMGNEYLAFAKYAVPIIAALSAIVAAMAVWNYLYTAKSVSAMHSFPISRKGLFCTNYISGIVMMLIPYFIGGGLTILVVLALGGGFPIATLILILTVILDSIFFFSFATFVAMIAGNIIALPVMYGMFNFLQIAVESLLTKIYEGFTFGFSTTYGSKFMFLTPLVYLMRKVEIVKDQTVAYPYYKNGYDAILTYDRFDNLIYADKIVNYHIIAIYGVIGLLLAVASYAIYMGRKSESAGETIAIKGVKPVIEGLFTALAGGGLGLILYYIFGDDYESYDAKTLLICTLIAVLIAFVFARILAEKTIKIFNKGTAVGALASVAVTVAFILFCKFDLLGVESYVPDASKVQSVCVYANGENLEFFAGKDDEMIKEIIGLHENIIAHKDELRTNNIEEGPSSSYDITITYSDGKKITARRYPVYFSYYEKYETQFMKYLREFFSDGRISRKVLEIRDGYELKYVDCDAYRSITERYEEDRELSVSDGKKLWAAIRKDIESNNYCLLGNYGYSRNYFWIEFSFEKEIAYQNNSCDWKNIEINVNMVNTLKALSEIYDIPYEKLVEYLTTSNNDDFSYDMAVESEL